MTDDNAPLTTPDRSPSATRTLRRPLMVISIAGVAGIALVVAGILGTPGGDQATNGTVDVCLDGGCPTGDASSLDAAAPSESRSAAPSSVATASPSSGSAAPSRDAAASPTTEAPSSPSARTESAAPSDSATPADTTAQDSLSPSDAASPTDSTAAAGSDTAGQGQSPAAGPTEADGADVSGQTGQPLTEGPATEDSTNQDPDPATASAADSSPSVAASRTTVAQRSSAQSCEQATPGTLAVSTVARPGPCTTGVDTSVTLSAYPAGTLRTSTKIENARIDGDLIVEAPNVTLVNVQITGRLLARADNLVVENSTIGHLGVSSASNIRASYVEIDGHPGEDGIHVTSDRGRMVSNVVIENSWVHSPTIKDRSHYDGIQVRGVDGLTIRNVYFDLGEWKDDLISSIFVQNANGGNRNVTIASNWIDGGGYAMYLDGTGIVVTNNVFGSNARWGLLYPKSDRSRLSHWGNVWAHDGSTVLF